MLSSERAELFLRGHRSTLYTHPGTKLKAKPRKGRRDPVSTHLGRDSDKVQTCTPRPGWFVTVFLLL